MASSSKFYIGLKPAERGATMIEYALLLSLIGFSVIVALRYINLKTNLEMLAVALQDKTTPSSTAQAGDGGSFCKLGGGSIGTDGACLASNPNADSKE